MHRRVAIATLGCKVNQCESAGLAEALCRKDFTVVPFTDTADIYIINTCTVTSRTDYQCRQLIRRAHRHNPDAKIVVTGCYAQTNPTDLKDIAGVACLAGMSEKASIPDILNEISHDGIDMRIGDISDEHLFTAIPASSFTGHTRGFLKIQDGCDAFCSYCIIPYARGRSRSLPPADVLTALTALSQSGHREVVLTGIHLGRYGHDLSPSTDLLALLRIIERERPVERIRISSIEPLEVTEDLIEFMKYSSVVCRHLHIPLQSGDDEILTLMNRHYSPAQFLALLDRLTTAMPDMGIGIDVMTGFPGETDTHFEKTHRFIEGLPVAYCHVFPFSSRPGTRAEGMPGQVDNRIKKERVRILREMAKRKRRLFNARFLDRPLTILVENKKDSQSGCYRGFSGNYIPVHVTDGHLDLVNRIVTVHVVDAWGESLAGGVLHHG